MKARTMEKTDKIPDYKLRMGFTQPQIDRYRAFLEGTGRGRRSAGPFAGMLVMKAVEKWEEENGYG